LDFPDPPSAELSELSEQDAPMLVTEVPGPRSRRYWALDARHHASNSSLAAQASRIVVRDGRGAVVRDVDGNVFIDFASGIVVTNLGHCPAPVVEALRDELGRLLHFFDYATPVRPAFFEALAATLPPSLDTFQMYTTGSEAVEAAIRLAKSFTGLSEVISFYNAWHGRTTGAMALMGGFPQKRGYGPFPPGVFHSPNAYCYRCPIDLDPADCAVACARLVDRLYEQATTRQVAAVVIEPVQGVGGVITHPPEFLGHLRRFCDETGALLVFDEILCGAGRTGSMWAFEASGVVPDVLVMGKGLASGYPLSMLASRREVFDAGPFGRPGAGASTFASGNLPCAAGLATLGLFEDGEVLDNVRRVGAVMLERLRELADRHSVIGDVRGAGLLLGVELVTDRATKEPVSGDFARRLLVAAARRGLLTVGGGHILRITPPLVIGEDLARRGLDLLDGALSEVAGTS
jgi:4-aminobutyrate aminotransferase/(S)-3-amino-2-methylpropionate transaminase